MHSLVSPNKLLSCDPFFHIIIAIGITILALLWKALLNMAWLYALESFWLSISTTCCCSH